MVRFILAIVVAASLAPSAVAEEAPDCSRWTLKDLSLGMTFEAVRATGREFEEMEEFRDAVGYSRYHWQSDDALEKMDVHVDRTTEPHRVIGISSTIPASQSTPKEFLDSMIARWGPPTTRWGQGAFTLYTWSDEACDVSARIGAMNDPHDVAAWVLLSSTSHREQFVDRKRAARRDQPAGAEPGQAAPATPPPQPEKE